MWNILLDFENEIISSISSQDKIIAFIKFDWVFFKEVHWSHFSYFYMFMQMQSKHDVNFISKSFWVAYVLRYIIKAVEKKMTH